MRETLRLESGQNGAKSGGTIQQMAEQHTHWPRIRDGRRALQPVCRHEADEMSGALKLLVDFRQKRGAEWPGGVHSGFKCLMQLCSSALGARYIP